MEQYMRFKREHEDAILFFRMGDFYEMFFEDAKEASRLLGLTLTSRNHGKSSGDIPLAGIPHHALEGYVARLIGLGRKVAICEQVEDPKKAKGIVKRDVVEVISPGTALSDSMLDRQRNNFIAAICANGETAGVALVDLSTGDFSVDEVARSQLADELERMAPAELLLADDGDDALQDQLLPRLPGIALSHVESWHFEHSSARELLLQQFNVHSLKGFDCEDLDLGVRAAGAALAYLRDHQRSSAIDHINRLRRRRRTDHLLLDAAAQRNLDLLNNQHDGGREGSLLEVIDHTRTALGARLLRQWITAPLRDPKPIDARLDVVTAMVENRPHRARLREQLERIGDLERMMARVCCRRASPRDLGGLAASLAALPDVGAATTIFDTPLARQLGSEDLPFVEDLRQLLATALVDEPPASLTDGGVIRDGYDAELDELRDLSAGGRDWIARLQVAERERTGINSLKIGYNQVFGYYIEVSKANLDRAPDDYTRKQTLANAERFITPDLKDHEAKILKAEERISQLESDLFVTIRDEVAGFAAPVQQAARTVAQIDVLACLAELAEVEGYCRPQVDASTTLDIEGGRHPVVERQLRDGRFVPNDMQLDTQSQQIMLITGPNMAGKSTIIRQVGLIVLLAQMGSYVPAQRAHIGVVDRIFTRVGASDNLVRGESTFMVEMNEASTILNNIGPRSLILMDELGRGTSTYDGLSLAWAIVEFLHDHPDAQPRTLFATHYHELTELESRLTRVCNYNVLVREEEDRVVFLHRLAPGPCDRSYGIHVAQMAGMPSQVVRRATALLEELEADASPEGLSRERTAPQMDLFGDGQTPALLQLLEELRGLDVSQTTPLEALNQLSAWKERVAGDGSESRSEGKG
jgi:DNA mismatch repair protein MutS